MGWSRSHRAQLWSLLVLLRMQSTPGLVGRTGCHLLPCPARRMLVSCLSFTANMTGLCKNKGLGCFHSGLWRVFQLKGVWVCNTPLVWSSEQLLKTHTHTPHTHSPHTLPHCTYWVQFGPPIPSRTLRCWCVLAPGEQTLPTVLGGPCHLVVTSQPKPPFYPPWAKSLWRKVWRKGKHFPSRQ